MKKKNTDLQIVIVLCIMYFAATIVSVVLSQNNKKTVIDSSPTPETKVSEFVSEKNVVNIINVQKEKNTIQVETTPKPSKKKKKKYNLTNKEIKLIALVMMAEAEGEPEKGKRLVIDTILNRIDSKCFPNTVNNVIYQKGQFTSMWNGRSDEVRATKYACKLVKEELKKRLNKKVIFFTANRYSRYGKPLFRVGNHCFSSK